MDIGANLQGESPPNAASELLGLLKELNENKDPQRNSMLVDKTLNILRQLPASTSLAPFHPTVLNQLHGMGVNLWNKAVTLKSAAAISLDINAQLRHVASMTVLLCNPVEEASVQLTKKYITMGLKTGRAWLECDNPEMAETSLQLANQYWERMVAKNPLETDSSESLRLLFRVLCCQSEAALGVSDEEKAMELVRKAKDLLKTLDKEAVYLSMLCYNFGLQQFQCRKHESSVMWLKESYEIGRACSSEIGATKQARTLRLLATSYLEWNGQAHWQKALNAVGLANSEHSHPAGLLLKVKILLQFMPHVDDRVGAVLEDILNHPDVSLEVCMSAVREAYRHDCKDLAIDVLLSLKRKSKTSSDKDKLEQLHLELLLENDQVNEAKNVVESYIKAHRDGGVINAQSSQNFHILLWEQASKAYENRDFSLALQWYQYLLVLLSDGTSCPNQNISKLLRNCCTCYIELQDYQKAEEVAEEAVQKDEGSVHSHFLLFKVSILLDKEEKAKSSLQTMTGCLNGSEDVPGLLGLAAQMAFEKNNRSLAIEALECIARNPKDSKHALTSLRCLIRLKLTLLAPDNTDNLFLLRSILQYIQMAEQHIDNLAEPSRGLEASWFMKISWNTGLQAGEAFQEMSEAFEQCRKFSTVLACNHANYSRQKMCLLMASSASLQAARNTDKPSEKAVLMESVLAKVKQCQEVSLKCNSPLPSDPTPSLLLLYQLEAQLYLGVVNSSNDLMVVISSLPQVEPKLYETVAALIVQNPPKEGGTILAQNALEVAIKLYCESDESNTERLSRCTHSLIQLLMGRESSCDMVGKEQAMVVFKKTLQSIQEKKGFPEMEIIWHMVKAWNTGIHLYSMLRYKEAETWCSLSMKFLPYLPPDLMKSYQAQMTGIYDEILEKVDKLFSVNEQ